MFGIKVYTSSVMVEIGMQSCCTLVVRNCRYMPFASC